MSFQLLTRKSCLLGASLVFALSLATCGGQPPPSSTAAAMLSTTTPESPGTNCPHGGMKFEFGPDSNGNNVLEAEEIRPVYTRYVCHGAPGQAGQAGQACYDLDGDSQCDPEEDKDSNGTCDVNDCLVVVGDEFIRNSTSPQPADFHIEGSGTVGGVLESGARVRVDNPAQPLVDGGTVPLLEVNTPVTDGGSPTRRLWVDNAGNLVVQGENGVGAPPVQGPGTRFTWFPGRGALRAGTVGNTQWDTVNIGQYSWAGGASVVASAYASFAHGDQNTVSGTAGVVFGTGNEVSGTTGLAVGASNTCSGFACVTIGYTNVASGQGSVALGYRNSSNADYSVALGYRASANGHSGAFVWADGSTSSAATTFTASANNQFSVRAAGGVRLFTNSSATTGVTLAAGGSSWSVVSDRAAKTDFANVDGEEVLRKLAKVPVQSWVYKEEVGQPRHVGPMAQDFHRAFGLGHDDRTINTLDIDGINMVAIQALARRTAELNALAERTAALQRQLEETTARLERLERRLERSQRVAE